jgi:hypothetical protein
MESSHHLAVCPILGVHFNHALLHPQVNYDSKNRTLQIRFVTARHSQVAQVVEWKANLDFDNDRQLCGIEILFGGKLHVNDKLKYIGQYRVGFEELHEELSEEKKERIERWLFEEEEKMNKEGEE